MIHHIFKKKRRRSQNKTEMMAEHKISSIIMGTSRDNDVYQPHK